MLEGEAQFLNDNTNSKLECEGVIDSFKGLLRSQKLDLFLLQETKRHLMSEGIVRTLGSWRFMEWEALMTWSDRGGVWCGWLVV